MANSLKILNIFLKDYETENPMSKSDLKDIDEILGNLILFSYIWGVGGTVDETSRAPFDEFMKHLIH